MDTDKMHFSISESKKQANAKLAFANMLTMDTIRIKRLRKLISENFNGSQTDLSIRSGVSLSQLGQYLGGYRNLGEKTARKIELASGKQLGWLDSEDQNSSMSAITNANEINLTNNPDIQAVIKIMEMTDNDGKTLIRIKAQEIAQLRAPFIKIETPIANKVLSSSSIKSSKDTVEQLLNSPIAIETDEFAKPLPIKIKHDSN